MRILHLLNSNRFSGAENVVCQIMHMMQEEEQIEMIYCSPDGQIREALAERKLPFLALQTLSVSEVRRAIREYQPDLIHAHDMRAAFIATLACGKIPLISHIHNNNFDSRGVSVKSVLFLLAAIKSKRIFWVSDSAMSQYCFRKWISKKNELLCNIIDIDAAYRKMQTDLQEYTYEVAYIGRLSYEKNPERLLTVLQKVVQNCPDVRVAIVGTGDLEASTQTLCKDLGLAQNVSFLGFQSNPLKILHQAKVMVMTSRFEGTPMCALESLALGTPIVSTPTDGLCELIKEGFNGYTSDDDAVLADRIVSILTDEVLQKQLSEQAAELAREQNRVEYYKEKLLKQYRK